MKQCEIFKRSFGDRLFLSILKSFIPIQLSLAIANDSCIGIKDFKMLKNSLSPKERLKISHCFIVVEVDP